MSRLRVPTALARAGFDRIYFRGGLIADALDASIWSVLSQALGNEALTDEQAAVINALVVVAGVGDPRIWPAKVARLVGSYGKPFAATAAGTAFLDDLPLGPWAIHLAAQFLDDVVRDTSQEDWLAEATRRAVELRAARQPVPGFGVAGREHDERYVDFAAWYAQRPSVHGPRWRLFCELVDAVSDHGLRPNIGGAFGAVGRDFGFSALEVALVAGWASNWATQANAREALRESPEVLRKLPSDRVRYVGASPRKSPRATQG